MKETTGKTCAALFKVIVLVTLAQAARATLTIICTNLLSDVGIPQPVIGLLSVGAVASVLYALARMKGVPLSVLPKITNSKDRVLYILASGIVVVAVLAVPFFTRDLSLNTLLSLAYSAIVLPVFEEVLFRGYVWNRLKPCFKVELTVCMVTSVIYAVWNLGYIDIALSISNGATAAGVAMLLISHAVLGLVFGLIMGIARLLSKNCYPSILLHIILSLFIG